MGRLQPESGMKLRGMSLQEGLLSDKLSNLYNDWRLLQMEFPDSRRLVKSDYLVSFLGDNLGLLYDY